MIWRQVRHIEYIAHKVLGCRDVDDIGIVVDALEYLEWAITSRLELGIAFLWESLLAEVNPYKIAFLEDHLLLVFVESVCLTLRVSLKGCPCFLMWSLDVVGALVEVHVDAFM